MESLYKEFSPVVALLAQKVSCFPFGSYALAQDTNLCFIRSRMLTIGLQAWLAIFHSNKYRTIVNFYYTQEQWNSRGLFLE